MSAAKSASNVFIVKLAGACNLNCSYCYVYNLGDTTFRDRPKVMSRDVASATLTRIFDHVVRAGAPEVRLVLHGGEPLLVGKRWLKWFLDEAYHRVPSGVRIGIGVQTNGTFLSQDWIDLLSAYKVGIGVSVDGLPEVHDRFRVDHKGRGSYARVAASIERLRNTPAAHWGVLTVANPEYDPIALYEHFLGLGVRTMDFLWPDHHHDALPPWPRGTLARYYTRLFDRWYGDGDAAVEIRWLKSVMRGLLDKGSGIDALGPHPLTEVVIESDGSIEPLDVLRTCENGMTRVGLNVLTHPIDAIQDTQVFRECVDNQQLLPTQCHACEAYETCGGGYMPHRWSGALRFARESVHCDDLLTVIRHVHARLQRDIGQATAPGSAIVNYAPAEIPARLI